jgi:hypothetical protein
MKILPLVKSSNEDTAVALTERAFFAGQTRLLW